jgi:translation initiation factor IF-2
VVLEAESNPGRGTLATVLVQDGTLHIGDYVLCGVAHGRVRNLWLNGTTPVNEAGPASPVQISGLSALPEAGDRFYVFKDAAKAKEIAEERLRRRREEDRASSSQKVSLQNLWDQIGKDAVRNLNIILKADVKGTLEALRKSLSEFTHDEIEVKVLHAGVGPVTQDDILLADASKGVILGFHVPVDERARTFAEERQIEIRTYNVIYELLDDVKKAMEDRLAPQLREEVTGRAEILQVFRASKLGNIAGCIVRKGSIFRDSKVRLLRNNKAIFTGGLSSLKRVKDDVREVREGFECGLKLDGFEEIQQGDVIEAFRMVEERRSL